MALHGFLRCLKYIVFTKNLIVLIIGMILVGIALYMRLDSHTDHLVRATFHTTNGNINLFYMLCYILLATGTITTCAGFLGCGGAYQESRCMLTIYSILLFTIICGEVAGLSWTYVNVRNANYGLLLKQNMRMRYSTDRADLTNSIDYVQSKLSCCGATNAKDWIISKFQGDYENEENIKYAPQSCCYGFVYEPDRVYKRGDSICRINANEDIHKGGCRQRLTLMFRENVLILLAVQFFASMIQLFSLMLSFGLCCAMSGQAPIHKT